MLVMFRPIGTHQYSQNLPKISLKLNDFEIEPLPPGGPQVIVVTFYCYFLSKSVNLYFANGNKYFN